MEKTPVGGQRAALSVTMEMVAREAKVSRATVSRVLDGSAPVSLRARRSVEAAVARLGYVPNMMAQSLAARASGVVGLLIRDPRNPAYGLLHAEIQEHISAAGMQLITVVPGATETGVHERAALQRLLGMRVRGLMVATGVLSSDMLDPFVGVVPVVAVGRPESRDGIYAVSYDEEDNAAKLAHAVANHGHQRVSVVVPTAIGRTEGLRGRLMAQVLRSRGVDVVELEATGTSSSEHCETVIRLVREGRVTAAMFPTDVRMLWFIAGAQRAGLRVPADVSVTGCDGVLHGVDIMGLTTLRIPVEAVAARASAVMISMIEQPGAVETQHERLQGELIMGTTLAPRMADAP